MRWNATAQAVLPLLREEQGLEGQSRTSTAEERVIGAGLVALERNEDGTAIIGLFHMFAVTQEDFVHPMAVIELLWRSCCASEKEKQEGSLTTRLKVRQWMQLLVDHSLLLGSSSEGIHLHDIVLTFLRKRLSAEEMRAEHFKVVEGMISIAAERLQATGRGLMDTGSTANPYDGEEVSGLPANTVAADRRGRFLTSHDRSIGMHAPWAPSTFSVRSSRRLPKCKAPT